MVDKDEAQKVLNDLNSTALTPEWIILSLDEETGNAFVISKDVIAQRRYNAPTDVTWETSELRSWLNSEFFDSLPNDVKSRSVVRKNVNADNCSIPGGNDTEDMVFLLSIDEYSELLPESLRAAKFHGMASWWWLRSPGYSTGDVADVYPDGGLDGGTAAHGFYAFCDEGGVRPAMWLNLIP